MAITSFTNLKDSDLIDYFDYTIAKRGENYYLEGLVSDVKQIAPNCFTGVVTGTKKYNVKVEIKNNEIVTHCNCLCDFPCKHAAALLYYIMNNYMIGSKTKSFSKLARYMNGILTINKNNIEQFNQAINEEIKNSRSIETTQRIDYLFDLLNSLRNFTMKVDNIQSKKIILKEFENVDYNSKAFYNKMEELKINNNYYLMIEIVSYLEKDKITNTKLLDLFSKSATLLEDNYGKVQSSQILGIYNFNFETADYKKIMKNEYKVGEYVKGLYLNKRYNEILTIYNSQVNPVFDTIFYYILSANDTASDTIDKLIDKIVTKADFQKTLTLQNYFTNDIYMYLFDHYDSKEVLQLMKNNDKIGILIDNINSKNYYIIDELSNDLQVKYNNKILFAYQKIINFQLTNVINSNEVILEKYLKKLFNLKNGKYVLYLMYRHTKDYYYKYDHDLLMAFRLFMIHNNIATTVM